MHTRRLSNDDSLFSQPLVTLDRLEELLTRQGRLFCPIAFKIVKLIRSMAFGITNPSSIVITYPHLQALGRTVIVRTVLFASKNICIEHNSGGGEIRTLDAHKAHTGFRDQPIQPL